MIRAAALLVIFLSAPAFAGFSSDSRGSSAATFLTLGAGARAAGMAGAQTGATEGAFSMGWNPGGIAAARANELAVMHADWFEGVDYNVAAAAIPIGERKGIGLLYQQLSAGQLQRRDDAGYDLGEFEPTDMSAALAWGWHIGDYAWGISGKMIRSEIISSAQTVAADIGMLAPEENGRRWGVAVQNVGGTLKFDTKSETLPVMISVGGIQRWRPLSVAADLKFPRDNAPFLALAIESGVNMGETWRGMGRLGYSSRTQGGPGSLAGFAVGAGLQAPRFSLDYAFTPFGDLGSMHLFSISLRGGARRAAVESDEIR